MPGMTTYARDMCGRSAALDGPFEDPTLELSLASALGRAEERERLRAIVTSDEARVRPRAAAALAFSSDLAAGEVVSLLAALPTERRARKGWWR